MNSCNVSGPDAAPQAQQPAIDSAELHRVLATVPVALGVIRTDAFLWVNEHLSAMTGYTPAELLDRGPGMLFLSKEACDQARAATEARLGWKMRTWTETRWRCRNGRICDIQLSATRLDPADPDSPVLYTAQDITERKDAHRERERLQAALARTNETVAVLSPGGFIQYVNPALERILGVPKEELIGRNPFAETSATLTAQQHTYRRMRDCMRRGAVWRGRLSEQTPDGSTCHLDITISPLFDPSGTITGFVAVGTHISRELQIERNLQHRQKMEAIGILAGGITHDFNNVLAAIIGYSEIAAASLSDPSPAREPLLQVQKSAARARELIRQILSFCRKTEVQHIPVQLGPLIRETVQMVRATIPATIAIKTHIDTNATLAIADPTQMYQVLLNLTTNASQAMAGTGGILSIRLSTVSFAPGQHPELLPGEYLQLSVTDTGPGIAPNVLEHIFEPFFTTKAAGQGTGMGLTVAHEIIRDHGGAISVESHPGQGAAFIVLLPRAVTAPEVLPAPAVQPRHGTESILFVDDEKLLAKMGRQLLTSLGYRATAATSGAEALELFQNNPHGFDLVITDYTMPGMTGYDLARAMRVIRSDIPVIVCTGYSPSVSSERTRQEGLQALLLKPIGITELSHTVRSVLDNPRSTPKDSVLASPKSVTEQGEHHE